MFSETYTTCSICSDTVSYHHPCATIHPDHCHSCYALSLSGNTLERQEHLAPETPLALSARDVQALVRYRIHKQAVLGTGPCTPLLREEGEA